MQERTRPHDPDALTPGDDEALFARFQDGEPEAFERLVERYQTPLVNFVHRLTLDYELACDITQATFLEVLRWGRAQATSSDGEPLKRFRWLLYRFAQRQSVDAIRRARVRRARSLDEPVSGAAEAVVRSRLAARLVSTAPGPEDVVLAAEEARLLRRCVAGLPPESRDALALRFYEGFSFQQIGQILGCREGTARQRVHYALARLRKRLGLETDPEEGGAAGKGAISGGVALLAALLCIP